jgi:hypothetical protein
MRGRSGVIARIASFPNGLAVAVNARERGIQAIGKADAPVVLVPFDVEHVMLPEQLEGHRSCSPT